MGDKILDYQPKKTFNNSNNNEVHKGGKKQLL